MNRGLMVIGSLCHLVGSRELTDEEEGKALVLGWCVGWVSYLMLVVCVCVYYVCVCVLCVCVCEVCVCV